MAHEDTVERLKQGASAWNARRADQGEIPVDLSGAPLRALDLTGADLSGADLRDADLRGTVLTGANLAGARLGGANLFKAALDGANLKSTDLSGVRFLNCAQLQTAQAWQAAFRDEELGCGAPIPAREV